VLVPPGDEQLVGRRHRERGQRSDRILVEAGERDGVGLDKAPVRLGSHLEEAVSTSSAVTPEGTEKGAAVAATQLVKLRSMTAATSSSCP